MAYPTVDAPYGLRPVNLIGGLPFAGATREIPIASAYATALYNGDVVAYKNDGTLIITTMTNESSAASGAPLGVAGVFLGCSYTDPVLKYKLWSQYYPGGVTASDITAYVCDDPNALFKAVNVAGTTADGASSGLLPAFVSRANAVPTNASLVLNTGLAATGNSRMGVYINNVTTALPFRVVDVVSDTKNTSGNFVEFIVKFNPGFHSYTNAVGI